MRGAWIVMVAPRSVGCDFSRAAYSRGVGDMQSGTSSSQDSAANGF